MTEDQEFTLPPLEERPLVTFALFAYNQEKYIREAVEGAFAQTYEPLEIILSDDCSTDRTFEIMEEMVSKYNGPHSIILNKTQRNNGLSAHIMNVARISIGKIIVMAAGDDISTPNRAKLIAEAFRSDDRACAVFSDMTIIDQSSITTSPYFKVWSSDTHLDLPTLIRHGGGIGAGATYAYRKECFFWPWKIPESILSEDRLLPLRAKCIGTIKYVSEALVSYRILKESLTHTLHRDKKLSFQNDAHINELIKTIEEAKKKRHLNNKDANLCLRILGQMPKYVQLSEKIKNNGNRSRIRDRVLYNWLSRDTLIERIKKKIIMNFSTRDDRP